VAGLLRKFARGFSGSMAESMSLREKEAIHIEREKRLNAQRHKEAVADRTFRSGESRLDRAAQAREGLLERASREKGYDRTWEGEAARRKTEEIVLAATQDKLAAREAALAAIEKDKSLDPQEKAIRKLQVLEGRGKSPEEIAISKKPTVNSEWDGTKWVEKGLSIAQAEAAATQRTKWILDRYKDPNNTDLGPPPDPDKVHAESRASLGLPPRKRYESVADAYHRIKAITDMPARIAALKAEKPERQVELAKRLGL